MALRNEILYFQKTFSIRSKKDFENFLCDSLQFSPGKLNPDPPGHEVFSLNQQNIRTRTKNRLV